MSFKLALLNTTIITSEGVFRNTKITTDEAKAILGEAESVESFIGHEATANAMSTLLSIPVAVNRGQFSQDAKTIAICLKLRGRLEEGRILSLDELEAIGYDLFELAMVNGPI